MTYRPINQQVCRQGVERDKVWRTTWINICSSSSILTRGRVGERGPLVKPGGKRRTGCGGDNAAQQGEQPVPHQPLYTPNLISVSWIVIILPGEDTAITRGSLLLPLSSTTSLSKVHEFLCKARHGRNTSSRHLACVQHNERNMNIWNRRTLSWPTDLQIVIHHLQKPPEFASNIAYETSFTRRCLWRMPSSACSF
jgi:hypothetical protein